MTQAVYDRLERSERAPKRVVDHSATWAKLEPVGSVNGLVEQRVRLFCEQKNITMEALTALGARVAIRSGGQVHLAFAGDNGAGQIVAIKYRALDGTSHDSTAELPSNWLRPLVIGNRDSLCWIAAEGESDAARLWDLVGDVAAILVLPSGALTFKKEWADRIPSGATVVLAHDADEYGDQGAERAAKIIRTRTIRVRPPIEGGDWCDWPGGRDEILDLLRASQRPRFEFASLSDFLARPYPRAEALLGAPGAIFLAIGSLLMVYGADGSGKSTWSIDGLAHLAAGQPWLGIPVPRPVRIAVIENEGPPSLFQEKLEQKIATWTGPAFGHNVFVFAGPWGEFSFADPDARAALNEFCDQHRVDVVTANPTLGLGVAASGKPDETQQFVDWLVECGLKANRAFWLLHHENKAGQISGDWGRHPDTKVSLRQDGDQQRTKLDWAKTRWATLPTETIPKKSLLEWVTEGQGYNVVDLDSSGASDNELESRIAEYLTDNPWSPTRAVYGGVKGDKTRIRRLLDGDQFDCVNGPRSAILWNLAAERSDEPEQSTEQ